MAALILEYVAISCWRSTRWLDKNLFGFVIWPPITPPVSCGNANTPLEIYARQNLTCFREKAAESAMVCSPLRP